MTGGRAKEEVNEGSGHGRRKRKDSNDSRDDRVLVIDCQRAEKRGTVGHWKPLTFGIVVREFREATEGSYCRSTPGTVLGPAGEERGSGGDSGGDVEG